MLPTEAAHHVDIAISRVQGSCEVLSRIAHALDRTQLAAVNEESSSASYIALGIETSSDKDLLLVNNNATEVPTR